MPYSISIDTDGAAFEDPGPELARILRKLADGLDRGGITPPEPVRLFDVNGNTAGRAQQVEHQAEGDAQALDLLSAWLCYPDPDGQWRSAADFIELAAAVLMETGRSTDPEPWTDEHEHARDARAAALVARATEPTGADIAAAWSKLPR